MKNIAAIFAIALLCTGCVSLVEKGGQALDGSAFAEKRVSIYRSDKMAIQEMRSKEGEASVIITLERFPAMKLRGSAPDAQGEFSLSSRDYLGGNTNGWNEYRLDIYGSGKLVLGEASAALSIPDEIEAIGISSGRIRRFDTRFTGTEAVSNLRNRYERIISLAEWMNTVSEGGAASETGITPRFETSKEFEKYWKPILFPELIPKKKQPEGWQLESDEWERAEDIRWNTGYTQRTFAEELWAIRNSGTMLRDWEEALEWVFIEFEWPRILETLAQETTLLKAKK